MAFFFIPPGMDDPPKRYENKTKTNNKIHGEDYTYDNRTGKLKNARSMDRVSKHHATFNGLMMKLISVMRERGLEERALQCLTSCYLENPQELFKLFGKNQPRHSQAFSQPRSGQDRGFLLSVAGRDDSRRAPSDPHIGTKKGASSQVPMIRGEGVEVEAYDPLSG